MARFLSSLLIFVLTAVSVRCQQQGTHIGGLRLVNVHVIPNNLMFDGTPVGGLSGIDYDRKADVYYLLSDDRSSLKPARYYTATIPVSASGIDTVIIRKKVDLLGPDGNVYPTLKSDPNHAVDPEGIRYNPANHEIVWVSEGERIVSSKDTILVDPSITAAIDGRFQYQFALPPILHMTDADMGPRQNGTLEATSFTENYQSLWVALEEPLYQDGPRADLSETNSFVRFFKFNVSAKSNTAQYAYKLEAVAHPPILPTAFRVNGVTDILDAGNNQFIVLERSFSTGRLPCTVKIFLVDLSGATNIIDRKALSQSEKFIPAKKSLLLNMDDLSIHVDNIEGVTWGPLLPNGNRSLVLISDNNFQSFQKTQVFLLEVIP